MSKYLNGGEGFIGVKTDKKLSFDEVCQLLDKTISDVFEQANPKDIPDLADYLIQDLQYSLWLRKQKNKEIK